MLPTKLIRSGDKYLQWRVARACAHPGQAGVDTVTPLFYRGNGVRHPKTQVVMRMHSGFCFRLQHRFQCAEAGANIAHIHCAAGIDYINTGRAVVFHQLRLLCQVLRCGHMAHHQKADGIHAKLTRILNMLGRHVCFSAVGRHAHYPCAGLICIFQVMNSADTRQQQRGNFGMLHHVRRRFNPLQVAVRTKAVVKAGTL